MMRSFILVPIMLLQSMLRRIKHQLFPVRLAMAVSLGLLGTLAQAQITSAQVTSTQVTSGQVTSAQVTSLRQQQIYQGDIAELTIEYQASIPSLYGIDTSILDTDFIVLDTRSSVSRVVESKQVLHRMHWAVQLLPRRIGSLHIPALKFGENHSEPMLLEVRPASALQQAQQNVFVEVEAYPPNPYPGQQTRIVTRLFHNLEVYDVTIAEPETSQAQVMRSGRELHYKVIRGDTNYQVLERSIVLTPNAGEQISFKPATYRGSIRPGNAARSAATTRYIYRHSNGLSLKLRALPPGFDIANWLPAQRIELEIEWDDMDTNPRPGDSLGVTLNLRVSGLPGEALPADLLLHQSEQYQIYADQETRSTQIEGAPGEEQFSGSLQQRYAIIFDQAGEITLPGLNLHWWNLDLDRAAVTSVAATSLTVSASKASAASSPVTGDSSSGAAKVGIMTGLGTSARGLIPPGLYQHWTWLLLLPGGLLMVTLLMLAKPLYARILARLRLVGKRRRCLQNLKQACRSNDAAQTRHELMKWGRVHWRDHRISSLHQLARPGQSAHWARELAGLDAAVFALQVDDWRGNALWELIRREVKSGYAKKQPRTSLLPGLYPQG
jgi:hypothetical protein